MSIAECLATILRFWSRENAVVSCLFHQPVEFLASYNTNREITGKRKTKRSSLVHFCRTYLALDSKRNPWRCTQKICKKSYQFFKCARVYLRKGRYAPREREIATEWVCQKRGGDGRERKVVFHLIPFPCNILWTYSSAIGYCYNRGKSLSALRYLHCRLSGSMHESMARDMGTIAEYPAHIVCPRRHSLKNGSKYDARSSYSNKRAGYSAI